MREITVDNVSMVLRMFGIFLRTSTEKKILKMIHSEKWPDFVTGTINAIFLSNVSVQAMLLHVFFRNIIIRMPYHSETCQLVFTHPRIRSRVIADPVAKELLIKHFTAEDSPFGYNFNGRNASRFGQGREWIWLFIDPAKMISFHLSRFISTERAISYLDVLDLYDPQEIKDIISRINDMSSLNIDIHAAILKRLKPSMFLDYMKRIHAEDVRSVILYARKSTRLHLRNIIGSLRLPRQLPIPKDDSDIEGFSDDTEEEEAPITDLSAIKEQVGMQGIKFPAGW